MQEAVSSIITFPSVSWWASVNRFDKLVFDRSEHFQKMSYRNRYEIAGANGLIKLSVPLLHGRDQRAAMRDVKISNDAKWQGAHWRPITSAHGRSPYFEHYEAGLQKIFDTHFTFLTDFNLASIHWLKEQLKIKCDEIITDVY